MEGGSGKRSSRSNIIYRLTERGRRAYRPSGTTEMFRMCAGPAALADQEHVRRYIELVDQGLAQLRSGLADLGLAPFSHRAPFVMADLGRPSMGLVRALYERHIYVQPGAHWDMPTFLRVSVGTEADNRAFLKAVAELEGAT